MLFRKQIKQHKILIFLAFIMLSAFWVRIWDISELFVFKMDQARDIKLVQEAYNNGVGELPLLGPRAAKTYLRLGPIFYYFEYFSMWLVGNKSPLNVVWPDFILSILTIPLFYYFLRQAFNRKVSLMTTAVFASSFFLTQYSRFAWNPNSIPFWSLLFFLGLYKIVTGYQLIVHRLKLPTINRNLSVNGQLRGWLLVATIGYGVASQLHFTAALAYPLIAALFFAVVFVMELYIKGDGKKLRIKKIVSLLKISIWQFCRSISCKYWLGAIVILGVFYLPIVLSEQCTHWNNWQQFKYALSSRGKEDFSVLVKIKQSIRLHSEYFWFALTSFSGGSSNVGVLGFGGIIVGLITLRNFQFSIFNFQSIFNDKIFSDKKKIFFLLVFIWAIVMGALYTKLAFNVLKPRYWLLEVPLFFILLAVVLDYISDLAKSRKLKVKSRLLIGVQFGIVGFLVVVNLYAIGIWYWEVKNQQETKFFKWELKFKDENKISYGQLLKVVDYINEKIKPQAKRENKQICFYTTGEYRPVYNYIFENYYQELDSHIKRISFSGDDNNNCLFITIDHRQIRDVPRLPKNHKDEFVKVKNSEKEIGFVTIWQVTKKRQETSNKKQKTKYGEQKTEVEIGKLKVESRKSEVESRKSKVKSTIQAGDDDLNKKLKIKKPKRQDRVRWKDVRGCFIEKILN